MELTKKQRDTLLLIRRSIKPDDPWAKCSDALWPLIEGLPSELIIAREPFVRFSQEGEIVMKWLL